MQFAEALTLPAELIHYWMIGTGSLRPEDAYIYDRTWWGGSTLPPDDELLGYAREPNAQEALLGFIEVERLRTSEELDIYRRVSRRATEPEEVQLFQIAIEVREKNLASLDELSRKIKAVKPRRPVQRRKKKEGKNG